MEKLELISEIGRDIISSLDIKVIIEKIYKNLLKIIDAEIFVIGIKNDDHEILHCWGINGINNSIKEGDIFLNNDDLLAAYSFIEQKEIYSFRKYEINHRFSNSLFDFPKKKRKSYIYIPLLFANKKIGVLSVQSFSENAFDESDANILKILGNYIAIAFENSNAFKKIEEQKKAIELSNKKLLVSIEKTEEIVALRTNELKRERRILQEVNRELGVMSLAARYSDNGIMVMNKDGDVLWINEGFTRMYGYDYNGFIKERGVNIKQTSFYDDIEKVLDTCVKEKKTQYYHAFNISTDNKGLWTQTCLSPVMENNGEIKKLVAIDTNVDRIKKVELRLIEQTEEVWKSIRYASRIQKTLLPSSSFIQSLLGEYFIYFKPRDVVSGDFYWIEEYNNNIILVTADCTGHGIPGALMSMLGVALLNEIYHILEFNNASDILNELRNRLVHSLSYSSNSHIQDGIDMSLCIINKKKMTLQYSSANQFLLHVSDNQMHEYKGNKMPVGEYIYADKEFSHEDIKIKEGDIFYLASDGFYTQIGGPKDKKYMKRNFKEFLFSISNYSMAKQKQMIAEEFNLWISGISEQYDDVTVMGFKV